MRPRVRIIGITGPIGSGKSFVARILQKIGAELIDVDKLAHGLYRPRTEAWKKLIKCFGRQILSSNGAINRKALAKIVFNNKDKLLCLNHILHPGLKQLVIQRIKKSKKSLIVIDAALLNEIGLVKYVNEVWVVVAPLEIRKKRVKHSELARINQFQSQTSRYLKIADRIINNHGTLKELNAKIQAIF